ncbi:hypothetical protein CRI94_06060 [Longibacter salinarum]|uniref:PAS domain-containing protein n=1 Tax=Longibacter salinarum TaxID=1850348 RepID=A0A2A8D1A3_9BACT|nr:hypothetical protein [Longibacter salinarum]PEN14583.1 hypothetical protein CRI94_06060 [Longibacter salinarum]
MSSHDAHSSDLERDARWAELCDILNVENAAAAMERVQELQLDSMQETAEVAARSLDTGEAFDLLQKIDRRVDQLRDRVASWEPTLNLLQVDQPQEVPTEIKRLLSRIEVLETQHEALVEAGLTSVDDALSMVDSMEKQLDELYEEKKAQERLEEQSSGLEDEDTFDQLQRLLAREERLQRELGVTSSEEVIEMVRGLASQLDELYANRDAEQSALPVASGDGSRALSEREEKLQRELGVSDPGDVVEMVNGLVRQLEELYEARERLTRVNLDDAESVIGMISSMEQQLEALYADREKMSQQGIESIDQAISMIESMESQLDTLYEEREHGFSDDRDAEEATRLAELEDKLDELAKEKINLEKRRDAMSSESATDLFQNELGVSDPQHVVQLVQSLEEQLKNVYAEQEEPGNAGRSDEQANTTADEGAPHVVDPSLLNRLSDLPHSELDRLDVGVLRLNDEGRVLYANDAASKTLPGIHGSRGESLVDRNFFFSLAPGTSNSLFRGRFKSGVENDDLNVRFPYTIVHPTEPSINLAVHLYRTGTGNNWVFLRRLNS